jgi:hypothetical protein
MPYDVEMDELQRLQEIIARHEDHAFKVRGVMYGLLGALSIPLFSDKKVITGETFLILAGIVVLLFLLVELVHRSFVRLAIIRSMTVEEMIRTGKKYDGPLVGISLGQKLLPKIMFEEIFVPSFGLHYTCLILAVIAIGAVMW